MNKWEKIKEIYAGAFLIMSLSWVLVHLLLIAKHKRVVIAENNKWVLELEIVLTSLMVLLGLERLIKDIGGK